MAKGGWVYIVCDRYRGAIYAGVTSDLITRVAQHRQGTGSRFAARYGLSRLVYCERHDSIEDAISREKAIKKWRRAWKIELIEEDNPDWLDLFDELNG
jgi:putative endonuclease